MSIVDALTSALPAGRVLLDEQHRKARAYDYGALEAIRDRGP